MGYWNLETEKEGSITEEDINHIVELIKEGYTSGELNDEEED